MKKTPSRHTSSGQGIGCHSGGHQAQKGPDQNNKQSIAVSPPDIWILHHRTVRLQGKALRLEEEPGVFHHESRIAEGCEEDKQNGIKGNNTEKNKKNRVADEKSLSGWGLFYHK